MNANLVPPANREAQLAEITAITESLVNPEPTKVARRTVESLIAMLGAAEKLRAENKALAAQIEKEIANTEYGIIVKTGLASLLEFISYQLNRIHGLQALLAKEINTELKARLIVE